MTKEDIQSAINVLVDIHETESTEMAEYLGRGYPKVEQALQFQRA